MGDKEIQLSQKANDIYCDLGQKFEVLKDALKNIISACDGSNPDHEIFYYTARIALEEVEVKL